MPLEALHLWLPQPGAVEPAAGTRSGAQRRGDVAAGSVGAGPQDDCGLPQGQRQCHQEGLCAVRRAVPADGFAYMSTGMSSPPSFFFFPSFFLPRSFPLFSCSNRARRLSLVPTASCCRRRAQGVSRLAAFQRPPTGSAFTRPSTMCRLDGSGRLHSCPLPIYPSTCRRGGIPITDVDFGRSAAKSMARAIIASTYIRQLRSGLPRCCLHGRSHRRDGAHLLNGILASANLRCGLTATHPTCPTHPTGVVGTQRTVDAIA